MDLVGAAPNRSHVITIKSPIEDVGPDSVSYRCYIRAHLFSRSSLPHRELFAIAASDALTNLKYTTAEQRDACCI